MSEYTALEGELHESNIDTEYKQMDKTGKIYHKIDDIQNFFYSSENHWGTCWCYYIDLRKLN
jgi:hypothetical protein